ncbi:MAG TPA: MarC family protein [Bacteroidota bacterium]
MEKLLQDALILWATIDPVGTLALYAAITGRLDAAERRRTALKAVLYSFMILMSSIVVAQIILSGMGIRLISLQIAGGIILFMVGLKMVFGETFKDSNQPETGHDLAVFPLAVPSIASPGAIMAVILLTDNYVYPISVQAATSGVLLVILAITYVLMLFSEPILRVLGKNGAAIAIRVMGMVLAAFSVELLVNAFGLLPEHGQ